MAFINLTNYTIKDIINDKEKLTFLVGAGCSIDSPSCLPSGREMTEKMLQFTCPEKEIENILKIEDLRFEGIVELMRDSCDENLEVIDYYGQCDKPNFQHFYLAEMIKKGHFVITTNFDYLIEHAFIQNNVNRKDIRCVITKKDFETFNDPAVLFKQGIKSLYKIHGSMQNFITKESTKDSLVATIQAFGSNKEGLNIFQIEPFKKILFDNISNGRSMIIMGYSGSDDFDVVPTLKALKNVKSIVWTNYTKKDDGQGLIYEIQDSETIDLEKTDKINQILFEIKKLNKLVKVYRVDINTTNMIARILSTSPPINKNNFDLKPFKWLESKIIKIDEIVKYDNARSIYYTFGKFDDALRCGLKCLSLLEKNYDAQKQSLTLNNIGMIYKSKADFKTALEYLNRSYEIEKQQNNSIGIARTTHNIGNIYYNLSQYDKAMQYYNEALKIREARGDLKEKALILTNIGNYYLTTGRYTQAKEMFDQSLKINRDLGNLQGMAISIANIGITYKNQSTFKEALEYLEKALKIYEEIGDYLGIIAVMLNIGYVYYEKSVFSEAQKYYEEALKISDNVGEYHWKERAYGYLGVLASSSKKYQQALEYHKKSLDICEKTNDLKAKSKALSNIGSVYMDLGENAKALNFFNDSAELNEKIGLYLSKAYALQNIGEIYEITNNIPKAIEKFKEVLINFDKVGKNEEIRLKANALYHLGNLFLNKGDNKTATEYYNNVLKYLDPNDNSVNKESTFNKLGNIYLNLKNYDKAKEFFEKYVGILKDKPNERENYGIGLNNLAFVYEIQGNTEKAIEFYKKSIDVSSVTSNPQLIARRFISLAILYFNLKNYSDAMENCNKALKFYAESGDNQSKGFVLNVIGVLYFNQKDFKNAVKFYLEAITSNPNDWAAYYNMATINSIDKNIPEALKYLEQAIKLNPQIKQNAKTDIHLLNLKDLEPFKKLVGL